MVAVAALEHLSMNGAYLSKLGDASQGKGANDAVPEPAARTLSLAFDPGGEDIDPKQAQHLAPLDVGVIGHEHMLAPEAGTALNESKDPRGIGLATSKRPGGPDDGLGCLKVSPSGLTGEEVGE
jgi:hypothetical protein